MSKHNEISQLVKNTNQLLLSTKDTLQQLQVLPFNDQMIDQPINGIIDSTVVHRIIKKFERPVANNTNLLKEKCVDDWLLNEARIREVPKKYFHSPARLRRNIGNAKRLIREWIRDYPSLLKQVKDLRFPSGESFVSARGNVSFHQKMMNPMVFGSVTPDCSDAAIEEIMSHRSLRRCAKAHLKRLSKEENQRLFNLANGNLQRNCNVGDWILKERIRYELLNIVHGSRLSSVYKNTEERRLINVEAFLNVVKQLKIGSALRIIHSNVGNELDFGQDRHRSMIQDSIYATLDVKGGSNSTILGMVSLLYKGTPLWNDILETRSQFMLANIPADYGRIHAYVETGMLSAMGNGYTFEILGLTLLALCRAIDPEASVYGDDIIVRRQYAQEVADTIALMGYELNVKKSYLNGVFRESCGAFYLDSHGYVCCYDIKWCYNINDVINTVNKIGRIVHMNGEWESDTKRVLESTYDELIRMIPSYMKGPIDETISLFKWSGTNFVLFGDLPRWVEHRKKDWTKIHREDDYCRSLYKKHVKRLLPLLESWNYAKKDLSVIHVYSPRNVVLHKVYDHVTKPWTLSFYLMGIGGGGRMPDLKRVQPERREYRRETLFLIQGRPVRTSDVRKALRDTGS